MIHLARLVGSLIALVIILGIVRAATGPGWLDIVGPVAVGALFGAAATLTVWAAVRVTHHPVRRHRIAREYARNDH